MSYGKTDTPYSRVSSRRRAAGLTLRNGGPNDVPVPQFDSHWVRWSGNEVYNFQFMKALGLAQDGASTIPECLLTANRIVPGESESWFREWKRSGQESRARAERALAQGNIETAKSNWLRASNYFRTAGVFLEMDDKRRSPLLAEMENCSRHYLEHMTPIGEVIQIPQGDGSSLPAHFLKAPAGPPKKPVVICLCALDQIKDESFDAEIPVGYCVDNLQVRDDVDIERVVLYGSKFGGALRVPRRKSGP
jgi:hypothetical protein